MGTWENIGKYVKRECGKNMVGRILEDIGKFGQMGNQETRENMTNYMSILENIGNLLIYWRICGNMGSWEIQGNTANWGNEGKSQKTCEHIWKCRSMWEHIRTDGKI